VPLDSAHRDVRRAAISRLDSPASASVATSRSRALIGSVAVPARRAGVRAPSQRWASAAALAVANAAGADWALARSRVAACAAASAASSTSSARSNAAEAAAALRVVGGQCGGVRGGRRRARPVHPLGQHGQPRRLAGVAEADRRVPGHHLDGALPGLVGQLGGPQCPLDGPSGVALGGRHQACASTSSDSTQRIPGCRACSALTSAALAPVASPAIPSAWAIPASNSAVHPPPRPGNSGSTPRTRRAEVRTSPRSSATRPERHLAAMVA